MSTCFKHQMFLTFLDWPYFPAVVGANRTWTTCQSGVRVAHVRMIRRKWRYFPQYHYTLLSRDMSPFFPNLRLWEHRTSGQYLLARALSSSLRGQEMCSPLGNLPPMTAYRILNLVYCIASIISCSIILLQSFLIIIFKAVLNLQQRNTRPVNKDSRKILLIYRSNKKFLHLWGGGVMQTTVLEQQ